MQMDTLSFVGLLAVIMMIASGMRLRWYLIAAIVFGVNAALFGEGTLTQLFGAGFAVVSFVLLVAGLSITQSARRGGR